MSVGVKTRLARLEAGLAQRRRPAPPKIEGVVRLAEKELKLLPMSVRKQILEALERKEGAGQVSRDGYCRIERGDLEDGGLLDKIEAALVAGVWIEHKGES